MARRQIGTFAAYNGIGQRRLPMATADGDCQWRPVMATADGLFRSWQCQYFQLPSNSHWGPMLFILTGDIQTGKTRWLERLVTVLHGEGVGVCGVLAPGVWVPSQGQRANGDGLEKLGIDNLLLPEGTRVPFARRRDLALSEEAFYPESQSARAALGWEISDDAIKRVNCHFEGLAAFGPGGVAQGQPGMVAPTGPVAPSLLVVDELGRLELLHNGGLTAAVALLERGPSEHFPHAMIVVRDWLVPQAEERFNAAWGAPVSLSPSDESKRVVLKAFSG